MGVCKNFKIFGKHVLKLTFSELCIFYRGIQRSLRETGNTRFL